MRPTPSGLRAAHHWAQRAERFVLAFTWAAVVLGFSLALPGMYFTWGNFSVMFATWAPSAVLALAIIIPLTADEFDLSVGATLTLSSCIVGVLNVWLGAPLWFSVLAALAAGCLAGLVNAVLVIRLRVPSLVATIGTTSLMAGVVQWMTNSSTISGIDDRLIAVATGHWLGIPNVFLIALVTAAAIWYFFELTPSGRRLLFVGRGKEAARLNGVNVDRSRLFAFVASGGLAAFAGVLYAGLLGSADPYSGMNLLLPAFAAAFLGATAFTPGRFNTPGTIFAVYFLGSGVTGLTMLGIPIWVTSIFNGLALITAVALSQWARRQFVGGDDE